jgi:DNA repair protein RadC
MGASRIMLVHNHPSGSVQASNEDARALERLQEAGRLLDIELVDFLVIGENRYWSSKDGDTHLIPEAPPAQMSLEGYGQPTS